MKKLYLKLMTAVVAMAACATPLARAASELTVADGTFQNTHVPFTFNYADNKSCRTQVLYPASLVQAMTGQQITKITFYTPEAGLNTNFNWDMAALMGTTEATSFTDGPYTRFKENLSTVYSGLVTGDKSAKTLTIEFDTPFTYTGGNLVFGLEMNKAGGYTNQNFIGILTTDDPEGLSLYTEEGYNNVVQMFLPKTTFTYGQPEPYEVLCTPTELTFPTIGTGNTSTASFQLINKGLNAFNITAGTPTSANFTLGEVPASLEPAASATVEVSFTAAEAGNYTGSVTLNCGEAGDVTVSLAGEALQFTIFDPATTTLTVANGPVTNEAAPLAPGNFDVKGNHSQFIYTEADLTAIKGNAINNLKFYYNGTFPKDWAWTPVVVKMALVDFNTIETAFVTDEDATFVEVFNGNVNGLIGGNEIVVPLTVPFNYTGGNLLVDFYQPEKGPEMVNNGKYMGIETPNKGTFYTKSWQLTKTSVAFTPKTTFTYQDLITSLGIVTPDAVAFPDTWLTETSVESIKLVNAGSEPLTVSITAPTDASYTLGEVPATIPVGESVTVDITFAPTVAGEHTATLTVDFGAGGSKTVTITGTALQPAGTFLTVNDGEAVSTKIPFDTYNADVLQTLSQVIYPADQLTAMIGQQIDEVQFYLDATGFQSVWEPIDLIVMMGETTQTELLDPTDDTKSAPITTGLSKVYEGGVKVFKGDQTMLITFEEGYVYGGENLVLQISQGTLPTTYKYAKANFVGVATEIYNATTTANGNSYTGQKFLPKTRFAYNEMSEYAATVSPKAIDFGTVSTTETATEYVTVKNCGLETLTLSVAAPTEAAFTVGEVPATLASMASAQIAVNFAPTTGNAYNGVLAIDLGQAGQFTVTLAGEGDEPLGSYLMVNEGTDSSQQLPYYMYDADSRPLVCQTLYPESELETIKGKEICELEFYTTDAGFNKTTTNTLILSMGTTTLSQLVDEEGINAVKVTEGLTEVYNKETVTPEDATVWNFKFTTPFVYTGGNLVLQFAQPNDGQTANWATVYFKGVVTETYQGVKEKFSSLTGVKFLPQTRFTYNDASGSGIASVTEGTATIKGGKAITVEVSKETAVEVFDTTGRCVYAAACKGTTAIEGLTPGLYIVKADATTAKVVVK